MNDFFCGAGGIGLGFKKMGFEIAGSWDFDENAVASYKANVCDKVVQADITKMNHEDIPLADVWTFGFPCQDISNAGKKEGMIEGKTRSGLFYEIMRLLKETYDSETKKLPSVILAENVVGVKKLIPVIKREYEKLGYSLFYKKYNTYDFGIPQNRERYFIAGVLDDKNFEFKESPRFSFNFSDFFMSEAEEKFYLKNDKQEDLLNKIKNKFGENVNFNNLIIDDTMGFDGVRIYEGRTPTLRAHRQGIKIIKEGRIRRITPKEYALLQGFGEEYKIVVSDSQFYKQMGNAVSVPVSEFVAGQIYEFIKKEYKPIKA